VFQSLGFTTNSLLLQVPDDSRSSKLLLSLKLSSNFTELASGIIRIRIYTSPDGEQQFELAVGESVTATDISQPIEVSAIRL